MSANSTVIPLFPGNGIPAVLYIITILEINIYMFSCYPCFKLAT
ncbi:hypothetical protein LSH36_995g01059 [Paralvinella palmiformis]|uniref:Uncharacterized protein n=1 Tax=Paralvinella palmiformis TaxID=53620 RepID=A0AAD9IWT2_9ANNE|nr:hypothetical protein LSH36_995g01059 [Paralvinella palmiformis]